MLKGVVFGLIFPGSFVVHHLFARCGEQVESCIFASDGVQKINIPVDKETQT